MLDRAKQNIKSLDRFRSKANAIMSEVQKKLDQLADMVLENLNQGTNMEGILLGKIKEYALILDRENFDLRLDLDKELWESQIKNADSSEK